MNVPAVDPNAPVYPSISRSMSALMSCHVMPLKSASGTSSSEANCSTPSTRAAMSTNSSPESISPSTAVLLDAGAAMPGRSTPGCGVESSQSSSSRSSPPSKRLRSSDGIITARPPTRRRAASRSSVRGHGEWSSRAKSSERPAMNALLSACPLDSTAGAPARSWRPADSPTSPNAYSIAW